MAHACLGCRHNEDVQLRVHVEKPDHIGRGNPRFPYALESFHDDTFVAMLNVIGDVILNLGRWGQIEVLPAYEEELAEVA